MSYVLTGFGIKAFGPGITRLSVEDWIEKWRSSLGDFEFFLVLAGSKTAEVKGISSAGSTVHSRRYTAVADAELLLHGPNFPCKWPLPPLQAGVSPALISHVVSRVLNIKPYVITAGLLQTPPFPHDSFESPANGPANCLSTGKAMAKDRVASLWKKGQKIGESLTKPLLITECVPGGTSTALAVLTGLGLSIGDLVSGSARNPPLKLKKRLVKEGLDNANLGLNFLPKDLLAAVGDPFQAIAAGLLIGARNSGQSVLLGGGCQMLAVLSIALAEIKPEYRCDFVKDVAIGTTSWLVDESLPMSKSSSSFKQLMKKVGDHFEINLLGLSSSLDFTKSCKKELRAYELGYIKEGVGVGALIVLSQLYGINQETLVQDCEIAVDDLLSRSAN